MNYDDEYNKIVIEYKKLQSSNNRLKNRLKGAEDKLRFYADYTNYPFGFYELTEEAKEHFKEYGDSDG